MLATTSCGGVPLQSPTHAFFPPTAPPRPWINVGMRCLADNKAGDVEDVQVGLPCRGPAEQSTSWLRLRLPA